MGCYHPQVLQLEPLEECYHVKWLLFMVSALLLPLLVIPITVLFIYLGELLILFLSLIPTLVIVTGG